MYPKSDGPQYIPAGIGLAVLYFFRATIAIVVRFIPRKNIKLERQEKEQGWAPGPGYIL